VQGVGSVLPSDEEGLLEVMNKVSESMTAGSSAGNDSFTKCSRWESSARMRQKSS
jgi:hypothetical protein